MQKEVKWVLQLIEFMHTSNHYHPNLIAEKRWTFSATEHFQQQWTLPITPSIASNPEHYQQPWALPATLSIASNPEHWQQHWTLPVTLSIASNPEHSQQPWALPATLSIASNTKHCQQPWAFPATTTIKTICRNEECDRKSILKCTCRSNAHMKFELFVVASRQPVKGLRVCCTRWVIIYRKNVLLFHDGIRANTLPWAICSGTWHFDKSKRGPQRYPIVLRLSMRKLVRQRALRFMRVSKRKWG